MLLKSKCFILLTVLVFCLTAISTLTAQDKKSWFKAKQTFNQKSSKNMAKDREEATQILVDAIYADAEEDAAKLLVKHLESEIKRGGTAIKEAKVSDKVLNLCVTGFQKLSDDKAVEVLTKKLQKKSTNWRIRYYILKGLGGINKPAIIEVLVELLNDNDSKIKIGSF